MQTWLEQLAAIDDDAERGHAARNRAVPKDAPEQVHGAVVAALYSDLSRAMRLAEIGQSVADVRQDNLSRAFAAKCIAHVAYVRGEHVSAIAQYEEALRLFDESGAELESAKTLSSGLQTLILLGRYDQARNWSARAEQIFLKHGDVLRLARLDSNVGNIFFRQDQPREAIVRYTRALEGFENAGDAKDITAVLSNMAVCHTSLAQFSEAFACYRKAREVALANGLDPLAAQADYNIAYLHYLRGEYRIARDLYQACRVHADAYHSALCDLDEAELVLELNLTHEGEQLAARASEKFARLGMRYEQAKALVNLAVAASQRGSYKTADATLRKARALFIAEENRIWSAMTDLLRAVLAFHDHRFRSARTLSSSAWRVLAQTPMPGRAAYCQILLARLWLRGGHPDRARAIGRAALERLGDDASPSLRFHAALLEGEVHEMQGRWSKAVEAYENARAEIEDLRGRVDTEDLRISILKDKLALYDALISMLLDSPAAAEPGSTARAMLLVQQAKSRTLADRVHTSHESGDSDENLRRELTWCYRQIELAEMGGVASPLHQRAREIEIQVLRTKPARIPSISSLQAAIPKDTLLVEYYEARGVLYAFLLDREKLEAVRLGIATPVRRLLRLLQFQLGKSRMGTMEHQATRHHLGELYRLLFAPFEPRLQNVRHLVIAPHRHLHGLPFAALHDNGHCLIDRFTISTIPSAAVYAGCRARPRKAAEGAVVIAVGDARAPHASTEGQLVAELLPGARLFSGDTATIDAFRRNRSGLRFLHLATHAFFRRDNPLFSSIQFADGRVNLIELQHAGFDTELVTLSACNTGSSVSVGGDELLGMIRGFLAAGAASLVVSLWEIDDAATKEFMKSFYSSLIANQSAPRALRQAMLDVRRAYPHPYFWAQFIFVGGSV